MLTDEQLSEIEKRNRKRQDLRADIPSGRWDYDSFAFIENGNDWESGASVARADHVCILIRRRAWIDGLINACGDSILEEGAFARGDEKDSQPAHVGFYVEALLEGTTERDVAELIEEVRRLRKLTSGDGTVQTAVR